MPIVRLRAHLVMTFSALMVAEICSTHGALVVSVCGEAASKSFCQGGDIRRREVVFPLDQHHVSGLTIALRLVA